MFTFAQSFGQELIYNVGCKGPKNVKTDRVVSTLNKDKNTKPNIIVIIADDLGYKFRK